jgi:hypothetical protein
MVQNTRKPQSPLKVIGTDILAGLCFVGVILFGWLPGPGGIPLFILGLSLLASNHAWAKRWLDIAKTKGINIKGKVFPAHPWIRLLYDVISVLLVALGIYLMLKFDLGWLLGIYVAIILFGLALFLLNRDRLEKLTHVFKKKS